MKFIKYHHLEIKILISFQFLLQLQELREQTVNFK